MKSHPHAGQFDLRGKKQKLLRCGCCEVRDYRDWYNKKLAIAEIRGYIREDEYIHDILLKDECDYARTEAGTNSSDGV